jgi:ribosome-associated protein
MPISTVAALTGKPKNAPAGMHAGAASIHALVLDTLSDAKAEEIISIDLTGKTTVADLMVIASGRSQRHVGAIADQIMRKLKDVGVKKVGAEGLPLADWVLIDAGDIVIHIFRPEVRQFYNLEKMWSADRPNDPVAV